MRMSSLYVSIYWDLDTCALTNGSVFRELIIGTKQYIKKHFICWQSGPIEYKSQLSGHSITSSFKKPKLDFFKSFTTETLSDNKTTFIAITGDWRLIAFIRQLGFEIPSQITLIHHNIPDIKTNEFSPNVRCYEFNELETYYNQYLINSLYICLTLKNITETFLMNTNTGFRRDNTSQSQRENSLNSIQYDNTSSFSHLRELIRRGYYTFRQMCSCIRPQEQITDHQMDAKDNRSAKRRKLSNGYELTRVDIDYENPISCSSGVKAIESQPMLGPVVPESDSDVKLTLPSKEISAKSIQQNKRNKNKNSNKRGKNGNKSYQYGDPIVIPDLRPYIVVKGVCGLRNLGNTCYMNSGIQCLVNIALFNEFIKDLKNFLVGFKQTSQKLLIELMAELMEEMLSSRSQSVSPINFRRKVAKTFDIFSNNEQNDCFLFVVTILDQFHNELLQIHQNGYQSDEKVIEYNNFDDYLKFNNTFISRNFHGFLRLSVECDCGQTIATNYQPFPIISLPQIDCNDLIVIEVSLIRHNSRRVEKMRLRFTKSETLISQLIKTLTKTYYEITKNSLLDNQLIVCKVINHKIREIFSTNENMEFWSDGDIYVYEIDPKFTRHYFVSLANHGMTFGTPLLLNVNDSQYSTIESTFVSLIDNNLPNIKSNLRFLYCNGDYLIENWSQKLPYAVDSFLATDMDNELIQLCLNFYQVVNHNQSSCPQSSYSHAMVTLDDCITQYLSNEKSDEKCADCRTRGPTGGQNIDTFSSLSYAILHAPNVLLLQLKSNPSHRYNCQFPLELDLKNYVTNGRSDDGQYVYDLVAVSNYSGSSYCGHYTAYAKNCLNNNNNWYEFNDSYVDQILDVSRLQSSNAYILVYVKRNVK